MAGRRGWLRQGAGFFESGRGPDAASPYQLRLSRELNGSPGRSDWIGYAAWAAGLIGLGAEEDADGDGNLNFVEYALGSRADGADPRPFVRAETEWVEGVAFVRLSFDRRIGADDVVVTPQWSDALGNWVNSTVFCDRVEVVAGADGVSRESHRCRVPAAQQGKGFFRLKLTSGFIALP